MNQILNHFHQCWNLFSIRILCWRILFGSKWNLFYCFLALLFLYSCQTSNKASKIPVWQVACAENLKSATFLDKHSYYPWQRDREEEPREFSETERQILQSLELGQFNNKFSSSEEQEQPQKNYFRSILPLQSIDGWNFFVIGTVAHPLSRFIENFILLIEGSLGWQKHFLFPAQRQRFKDTKISEWRSGYDLTMFHNDFDHDGRKEFLFTSSTGGSGGYINIELLRIQPVHGQALLQIESLEIPSVHMAEGSFQDNFLVRIQLKEEKSPILIRRLPVARQRELGFDKNGKWTAKDIQVPWLYSEPNWVKPVELSCNNTVYYLLYTLQPLKGIANFDTIGKFKSFWLFQGDKNGQVKSPQQSMSRMGRASEQKQSGNQDWVLIESNFVPAPGNELLEYESLLP